MADEGTPAPDEPEPRADAPTLTALNPASVDISSGAMVPVTITGTGFGLATTLVVNGSDDICDYVSDTELTTNIDTSTASGPSTLQLSVRNIDGQVSNSLPLELTGEAGGGGEPPEKPMETKFIIPLSGAYAGQVMQIESSKADAILAEESGVEAFPEGGSYPIENPPLTGAPAEGALKEWEDTAGIPPEPAPEE